MKIHQKSGVAVCAGGSAFFLERRDFPEGRWERAMRRGGIQAIVRMTVPNL